MKTRKSLRPFFLFLCTIALTSCGGNDEENRPIPLSFEKGYYESPLARNTIIDVRGGNRDYALTVENTDILDAHVDLSSEAGMGRLVITPKATGETTLTVRDNVTDETVDLTIKVTNSFLAYRVVDGNHPTLSPGTVLFLVNNEAGDCYFFRETAPNPATPVARGTYSFSIKQEIVPYLTLNYAVDSNGQFSLIEVAPSPHEFRLEMQNEYTNPSLVRIVLEALLGIDLGSLLPENASRANVSPPARVTLSMSVDDTDYVIRGYLDPNARIPEGILGEE